jgi:hypothetical protein
MTMKHEACLELSPYERTNGFVPMRSGAQTATCNAAKGPLA